MSAFVAPKGWMRLGRDERDALVEPFYADYLARRKALGKAGVLVFYNSHFRNYIPGIDAASGTSDDDRETAIYHLQDRYDREQDKAKLAKFVERGAVQITPESFAPGEVRRGTVAVVGEYMGGTGFRLYKDVRVLVQRGYLVALPKGAKKYGYPLMRGDIFMLTNETKGKA